MTRPAELTEPSSRPAPRGGRAGPFRRAWGLAGRHRAFAVLLAVGFLLRLCAVLAYRPALLYNDTFEYVDVTTRLRPFPERPDGYSFFLLLLEPLHSFLAVAAVQHALGLATSVLVYALVRGRFGLPAWAGCVAAAPILLDAFWIDLEQILLSDSLFTLLLVAAVAVAVGVRGESTGRPGVAACAGVGALLAAATLTRPAALPAVLGLAGYLLVKRVGWRALATFVVALALPIVAYASWYAADHGRFSVDDSTGIQLYGRVGGFADCARMGVRPEPPATSTALGALCPTDPGNGKPAPTWVWYGESPLRRMPGPTFTPRKDALALRFATRAIARQPGDYLAAVGRDLGHALGWKRGPYPNAFSSTGWTFPSSAADAWRLPRGGFEDRAMTRYEHGDASTKVYQPFADVLRGYQKVVFLRGPLLAALTALGLAGLVAARGRRLESALVTLVGLGLALMPIFTVQLDYRYLMPSYPFLGAAAAVGLVALLTAGRGRSDPERPAGGGAVEGGAAVAEGRLGQPAEGD